VAFQELVFYQELKKYRFYIPLSQKLWWFCIPWVRCASSWQFIYIFS